MELVLPNRVLITGINGFIASHIAERLIIEGISVRGLCRRPDEVSWLELQGVELVKGDLLDAEAIKNAVSGCDVVIHAAGWSGGGGVPDDLAWKTNVDGSANVLSASKAYGVERFIYISSIAVYGFNKSLLIDESMPTPLINELYPDSKITAEELVRTSSLPYTIIRPGCTYGPRGEGWTVGIIKLIKDGVQLQGNDDGLITPGYISNFVDGVLLCIIKNQAIGHTFNICDDKTVTYREFYLAFAKMLGISKLSAIPVWRVKLSQSKLFKLLRLIMRRSNGNKYSTHFRFNTSQYSIKKAQQILGYQPKVNFKEGMKKTEIWLRENGYLY
ncbi:MAG: NAD-dependent epimerase/dehydratase family protein [Mucilaginibacter sp.]